MRISKKFWVMVWAHTWRNTDLTNQKGHDLGGKKRENMYTVGHDFVEEELTHVRWEISAVEEEPFI